jgi:hypothetical protein
MFKSIQNFFKRTPAEAAAQPNAAPLVLAPFLKVHPPVGERQTASKALIKQYRGLLPESLLALWQRHGLGFFGSSLFQLIDPNDYKENLYDWMREDSDQDNSRIPFALNATGHIFYYRILSDKGDVDVSVLDPHGKQGHTDMVVYSMDDFFNGVLCHPDDIEHYLQATLIKQARAKLGDLKRNEIYFYVPALRLGSGKRVSNMDKGSAMVHLDILLQMSLN